MLHQKIFLALAASSFVLCSLPFEAHASDSGYGSRRSGNDGRSRGSDFRLSGRDERSNPYSLSVAGGVAAPSSNGFLGENPAGLIYNQHGGLLAYLTTAKEHPELLSNGLSFFAGNGLAAATIGVQTYNNAMEDGGSITSFNFGVATYAEGLDTSFGLSGSYRFQNSAHAIAPELQTTWSADFGFLYNPFGTTQFGVTLYDLSLGMRAVGAGFATHINSVSVLGVDVSTDNHGRGMTVKPGIGVHAGNLNLTYGYGMQVDKTAISGITPGNTIGLGYDFTTTFRMIGYYNHFSTYFLGATIDLF